MPPKAILFRMTILEPVLLGGALLGCITGAVWGFISGGWAWGVGGFFAGLLLGPIVIPLVLAAMSILFMAVIWGPRKTWRHLRGQQDA
ncbi:MULTISPECIES: hypothetical protein [unclassified Corallococcus]|uniref:hypothetical protein n=1 Tax=unclassified Corallococcus TaxID=2685029 RepID=UPI001A8DC870|nr:MULTISPECIES: hypothetical protein [unclassified Corallococcus]MBN9685837.1 hypothetical protein [Corallococcus sp. NCSPR001]WAS82722.1 hypothetical protein O0N60_25750 [Corallococcus sp. NCRR]